MDDDNYDLGHGFSQKAKHSRENLSKKSINSTSNPIKPFCFYQSIFEILASGDELVYEDYADEDELEENEQIELAESNADEDEHKCYFEGAGEGEGIEVQLAGLEVSIDNLVNAGLNNDEGDEAGVQKLQNCCHEDENEVLEEENSFGGCSSDDSTNFEVLNDDSVRLQDINIEPDNTTDEIKSTTAAVLHSIDPEEIYHKNMDISNDSNENAMIRFYKDEFNKKSSSKSFRTPKKKKKTVAGRKRGSLDEDINTGNEKINSFNILSQARKIRSSENLSTDSFGFEFYYMKRERQKQDELYALRRANLHARLAKQAEIPVSFCQNTGNTSNSRLDPNFRSTRSSTISEISEDVPTSNTEMSVRGLSPSIMSSGESSSGVIVLSTASSTNYASPELAKRHTSYDSGNCSQDHTSESSFMKNNKLSSVDQQNQQNRPKVKNKILSKNDILDKNFILEKNTILNKTNILDKNNNNQGFPPRLLDPDNPSTISPHMLASLLPPLGSTPKVRRNLTHKEMKAQIQRDLTNYERRRYSYENEKIRERELKSFNQKVTYIGDPSGGPPMPYLVDEYGIPTEIFKSPVVTKSPAKFAYVSRQELDDMLSNPDFEFQLVPYYEKNEKHVLNTTVTQVPNNTKNTVSKTQDIAKISKVPNYNYSSKYQNQTPPSYESPPFESIDGKRGMNREPVVAENDDEDERKTLTERFLSVCPIFYVCFLCKRVTYETETQTCTTA